MSGNTAPSCAHHLSSIHSMKSTQPHVPPNPTLAQNQQVSVQQNAQLKINDDTASLQSTQNRLKLEQNRMRNDDYSKNEIPLNIPDKFHSGRTTSGNRDITVDTVMKPTCMQTLPSDILQQRTIYEEENKSQYNESVLLGHNSRKISNAAQRQQRKNL